LAHHKSAVKRARQGEEARLRNNARKTRVKGLIKEVHQVADEGTPEEAQRVLTTTIRAISKAASKGTFHKKTASRKIARLSRHVHKSQVSDSA
jgi:small subunit ribosomal protein S20